jgi:tetratricopeptide (TPR) repeat protein
VFPESAAARLALLLTLSFATYVNTLANGFVSDDTFLILPIAAYRNFDLAAIFFSKANALEYLPVRDLAFAIDFAIWGERAVGFHLSSLLVYLATIAVLFFAVGRLCRLLDTDRPETIAFWSTLIFAIHPIHTEVVAMVAERAHMLAGLFVFLSLESFLAWVEKRKASSAVIAVAAFLLACLSKTNAVFFPLFLPAILILIRKELRPSPGHAAAVLLPMFAVQAGTTLLHVRIAAGVALIDDDLIRFGAGSPVVILARAVQIPFFYLWKILVPYPLTYVYPDLFAHPSLPRAVAAALAVAALCFAAWRLRRDRPLLSASILWFFLALVPFMNLFPTLPVVAERYSYLAVLGFGLAASTAVARAAAWNPRSLAVAWLVVACWAATAITRNQDWRSNETLVASIDRLETGTQRAGAVEIAYPGPAEMQRKPPAEAIGFIEAYMTKGGDAYKKPHLDLALAYEATGQPDKALVHFLAGLAAKDFDPVLGADGKVDRALREGLERIRSRIAPDLGTVRQTADSNPTSLPAQMNAALLCHRLGMYEDAEAYYRRAESLAPQRWEIPYNAGIASMKRKDYAAAEAAFLRARSLHEGNPDLFNNLGICQAAMKNYAAAEASYLRAVSIDPTYFFAAFNLGRLHFARGNAAKSREWFSRARALAKDDPSSLRRVDGYLAQLP